MKSSRQVRAGMRIPLRTKHELLTPEQMDLVLATCNGWLNAQIRRGGSDAVFISDGNVVLQIKTSESGSDVATSITQYKITQLFSDYVIGRLWDGTAFTSDVGFPIAKPYNLRGLSDTLSLPYAVGQVIFAASSTNGTGLAAAPEWIEVVPSRVIGGSSGAPPERFQIVSILRDVYSCTRVSDSSTHNVARPTKLRCSIASESIDEIQYFYSYDASNVIRSATWTPSGSSTQTSEVQVIVPAFLSGDIIWAAPVSAVSLYQDSETIVSVTWLDLNVDGRAWATDLS